MNSSSPEEQSDSPEATESHLTAWHVFLVQLLHFYSDAQRLDVRDFVKLGTLPLEADVILLLKRDGAEAGPVLNPELDFLESRLRPLTVLEYKSPRDVLSRRSVDMIRVYQLLAKHKFHKEADRAVCGVLLYSYAQRGLFETLDQDGLRFEEEEPGIRCYRGSPVVYAVNLVALGRQRPMSLLNLVSARHEQYLQSVVSGPAMLALAERIQ